MAAEPISFSDLKVGVHGVYGPGWLGPVPANLTFEVALNQPHQIDPSVEKLTDEIADSISVLKLYDLQLQAGDLLGNVNNALYAVRYHQRQYLARLRMVLDRHGSIRGGSSSEQLSLVFHDHPLTFEMEALVTRYRAALDAAAQLLSVCLGRKPQKYGELAKWIGKQTAHSSPLAADLRDLLSRQDDWVKRVTNYRHDVAHQGRMKEHKSVGYGAHGVMVACVAEDDASDFVITIWPSLLAFLDDLFAPIRNQAAVARCADEARTKTDKTGI